MGLAVLLAVAAPAVAQPAPTGTWRVDGVNWTVFLKMEGAALTGLVSHCATVFEEPAEIYDATLVPITITFKCNSADRDRTIVFTGTVSTDSISFKWEKHLRAGGLDNSAVDTIFGGSAPRQFTAKRVPNGALAQAADEARGSEFAAAVNLPAKNAKTEGLLFVSRKVSRVRAVIVVIRYGLGFSLYEVPEWRKLSELVEAALLSVRFSNIGPTAGGLASVNQADGGADALFGLLQRLSQESGHSEVITAPLVIWGHSGGGGVASILAGLHPERTLAFIRYHSGPVTGDLNVVSKVPALLVAGARDTTSPPQIAETLWKSGRSLGAPWTFAVEPEATHGDEKDLANANVLLIPWIIAVVRQRLSGDASTLRVVDDSSAWMGDNRTAEIAPHNAFAGGKPESSWLPDEASARAWRALRVAAR